MALAYEAEEDVLESPPMRMPRDLCGRPGAEWLASRIEEYWAERGYVPPEIQLEQRMFNTTMRSVRFDVRSDMEGGLPKKKTAARK